MSRVQPGLLTYKTLWPTAMSPEQALLRLKDVVAFSHNKLCHLKFRKCLGRWSLKAACAPFQDLLIVTAQGASKIISLKFCLSWIPPSHSIITFEPPPPSEPPLLLVSDMIFERSLIGVTRRVLYDDDHYLCCIDIASNSSLLGSILT